MLKTDNTGERPAQAFSPRVVAIDGASRLEKLEQSSEWPEPDMSVLRANRRPPPVFPMSILGERWAEWVEHSASAAAAPVDYVVAPLLAAASAVIGHSRWAQAWEGWAEPPHLWCGVVGDSGDGKSPGASAVLRHIVPEIERRMALDFPDRLREAQAQIEAAKVRLEQWKEEVRAAVRDGYSLPAQPDPIPLEPIAPRLILSDATIERVATLLASAAPKGVLMLRDELAGWLLGMNAYHDGARAFWLEAYNGSRFNVDRQKMPEPIIIPRFAVSWFGGIQPARIGEIMEGPDDGLLARFIWFWPDPVPFRRPQQPPATGWAVEAFDRLRLLDMQTDEYGSMRPVMVPLSQAAVDRMVEFGQAMQQRKDASTGLMRSCIGKARGLVLRLALVLQYLHWAGAGGPEPEVIGEDAFLAAAALFSDYVIPAAERTYGDAVCSDADRNATTLARWIEREQPNAVHVREMQRNVRLPGLATADTIHAACRSLVDAGWLSFPAAPIGHQQRQTKAYPVSPRVRENLS